MSLSLPRNCASHVLRNASTTERQIVLSDGLATKEEGLCCGRQKGFRWKMRSWLGAERLRYNASEQLSVSDTSAETIALRCERRFYSVIAYPVPQPAPPQPVLPPCCVVP